METPIVFATAMAVKPDALDLLERFSSVRRTTETVCEGLTPEDHMVQSMADASPAKWHLAHTSWFFETFLLRPSLPGYKLFHDDFTFLFNSYYKQVGSHPNRAFRGLFSRPSLQQVRDYRRYVDRHMLKLLADSTDDNLRSLMEIGLNHEQQHQELIVTDVKHALWSNPLQPAWKSGGRSPSSDMRNGGGRSPASEGGRDWLSFDEALYSIGHSGPGFSFDNETPRHQVFVNRFSIASHPVTNGKYLEFIRDGGYSRPELWLSDGWDLINSQHWTMPLYWDCVGAGSLACTADEVRVYTVHGLQPLELSEPVCHISYYEAEAFARWSGARLPTEAEWETAASQQPIGGNFLESGRLHPCSAGDSPAVTDGDRAVRMQGSKFFGDVWEWTASPYSPYPGFRPAEGALGEYNGKFMCNQMVLRGGSCATPQSHIRATYRNFFPPPARWQFMGIRLAK
jgi:ergothioneine biosynthesis protein EgtB